MLGLLLALGIALPAHGTVRTDSLWSQALGAYKHYRVYLPPSYEQDRARNERSVSDTEYLTREIASLRMAMNEVATRDWIRDELAHLVKELGGHRVRPPAGEPPHGGGRPQR